ncbi:hypothetical protein amrb99_62060 [Actinomadura sp. RB99]|uniref:phage tail tape measure protein n=1 Tax=Actinomadura sp. RB99 TaxID=2691577 RepID=UPI001686362C|nr:phage tail tape measure protein [Actinomadura sp. RB99]MBD2897247.1 hypothetical protein [Actinomadura sp. RB99]
MALDLGELVATVSLDDKGFTGTLRTAERGLNRLESTTKRSLDEVEHEYERAGNSNVQQVRQAMNRMEAISGEGGQAAGKAAAHGMRSGLDQVETEAKQAGKAAGEKLSRGVQSELRGSRSRFRSSGQDVGEGAGDGIGEGAEKTGKSRFGKLGAKLAPLAKAGPWLAAGAAIGGVLMTGLAGAMEKQDAMAKLKASLGAFGPEADRLGKAAGHLFARGYGESMGEVTEALDAVVSSIGGMRNASNADIESMTAKVSDLATAFDLDVGRSAQIAGQMVKAGLVDNAKQGLDLLTATLSHVPREVREDVVDAIDEYSPFFEQIGVKGQQAFNLLAGAADKGAFGLDKTGDALKEFTLRATNMSASTKAVYDKIGLSQKKMTADLLAGGTRGASAFQKIVSGLRGIKDPSARAQAALALFGTPLEDLGTSYIPKFLKNLDATDNKLGKVGGAAERMGKTLHQTASQNLTKFQRTVKMKVTDFMGGQVLPGLTKFGGKANTWFQKWVGDNGATVDKVKRIWTKLTDGVGSAVAGVKRWLDDNKGKIDEWSGKIGKVVGSVADIVSSALDVASKLGQIFGPTLLNVIGIFVDTFLGYWSGLFTMIQGVWNVFAGIFTGDWGRVWKGIKQIFSGALNAVWSILKGALSLIWTGWKAVWNLVKGHVHKIWNAVVTLVKSQVAKLKAGVRGLASIPGAVAGWFGRMKDSAISKAKSLASWMRGLPGRIKSALGSLGSLLRGAGRNVISGLISGIKSKIGDLGGAMGDIAGKIRGFLPFSPAKEGPLSGSGNPQVSGAKIGAMLATGITSSRGRVAAAMSGLVGVAGPRAAEFTASGSVGAVNSTRTTTAPSSGPTRVIIDLRGLPAELKKWIRKTARTEGGGSVQIAFGRGSG